MEWKSFVFFKKKKFLVFAFLHFTLIETHPTFKSAESLQTILDSIRLPLIFVTKIMKRLKLKKVFEKERKTKTIGGKMRIDTFTRTEDDNGLLYVFSNQCKRKRKGRNKEFPTRIGCLQSFFFQKTFFKKQ